MKTVEAIQTLQRSGKKLFTLSDLRKLLDIESDNTAYKQARVLVRVGLLQRTMHRDEERRSCGQQPVANGQLPIGC